MGKVHHNISQLDLYVGLYGRQLRIRQLMVFREVVNGVSSFKGARFEYNDGHVLGEWWAHSDKETLNLDSDDFIKSVTVSRTGNSISSVLFSTMKGKGSGVGFVGTEIQTFTAPDGWHIVTFHGYYNENEPRLWNFFAPVYIAL